MIFIPTTPTLESELKAGANRDQDFLFVYKADVETNSALQYMM